MTLSNNKKIGLTPNTVSAGEIQRAESCEASKVYVAPAILSCSGEDILEDLGPAQACYPFSSCGVSP